jgi:predicted ATPase
MMRRLRERQENGVEGRNGCSMTEATSTTEISPPLAGMGGSPALDGDLVFGMFRLSQRRRQLVGPNGLLPLGSRAFDVLMALIERRDRLVSKDELMDIVWPDVVVEDNNLQVQISALRKAIGDGDRVTGDVRSAAEAATAPEAPNPPHRPPRFPTDGNVPNEITPLIGREADLATIMELLGKGRLVTLAGAGGIGKTKLALVAGRTAMPLFPDGVWLVELAPLSDPQLIANTIAAALEIEETPRRSPADSLLSALRDRKLLLILDNCEHLVEPVADLGAQLLRRCGGVSILVTSRESLGLDGENILRLLPLTVPDPAAGLSAEACLAHSGIRLFVDRARGADQRFQITDATAPIVADICRRLDGIPLALELAAARLPLLGLEALRARLADRFSLLIGTKRIPVERHRKLRSTIEWSHSLLPETDRLVLRRLGVFADGFTLEAAQHVVGLPEIADWDVLSGIESLLQRSLLTTGPDLNRPRHRLFESMRDFALEELDKAGERAALERHHAAWLCRYFEQAEASWEHTPTVQWLAPLNSEVENLRVGLERCFGPSGDAALGMRLAAASARYWLDSGKYSEGRVWLGTAIERGDGAEDPRLMLRLWRGLAALSLEPAAAVQAAEHAVALARQGEDAQQLGTCLRALYAATYLQGRVAEAEAVALEALPLLESGQTPKTLALCMTDLCVFRAASGDFAAARRGSIEALARLRRVGDDRATALHLQYSAEFEFADGQADAALAFAEESIALFRSLNSGFLLGAGLGNLAAYLAITGDMNGARAAAREALAIARDVEDHLGVVGAIEVLALVAGRAGAPGVAATLAGYTARFDDGRIGDHHSTEHRVHAALLEQLSRSLSPDGMARLGADGALMTEAEAAALALRVTC